MGGCGSCTQSCMKCGVILAVSTMQEIESPHHKQCLIACTKQLGELLQYEKAHYWVGPNIGLINRQNYDAGMLHALVG